MKKTYITTMPDHIGAFLKASRCFGELGINITRVSYNKAVDSNTLFIDAEGTAEQHRLADERLKAIGYLQGNQSEKSVLLLECMLRDVPGAATDILALINEFHFNISYISSQENGTDHQLFKMGLFVEEPEKIQRFLAEAEKLCRVRVIDYNHSEKVYDNSIFYTSFASGLARILDLSEEGREKLLVNANLAMQTLDELGQSPYRTFDSIHRFAELLALCRGEAFAPRVTRHAITEKTEIITIEPACGSNTAIIQSAGETLFVDSGYALYRQEMLKLLRELLPDFDGMKKRMFLTHADVDHGGMLPLFDEIYTSAKTAEALRLEYEGLDSYREQNPLHKPYVNICKLLTCYEPVNPEKVKALWGSTGELTEPLEQIGFFDFGELHFEVYEGKGGHLPGETVLIDYAHGVAFTGDVYINIAGLTPEQKKYNQYAPILMTSVETDPKLCAAERKAVLQRLGAGKWSVFGAHGMRKEYNVNIG